MTKGERHLKLKGVMDKTEIKKWKIRKLIEEKKFPQRSDVPSRTHLWLESVIDEWMKNPSEWRENNETK